MINRIVKYLKLRKISKIDKPDTLLMRDYYKIEKNIKIGKYTYGFERAEIASGTVIGNFCSIADGVKIGLMNHPMNYISTHPFLYSRNRGFVMNDIDIRQKRVIIDSDVWIGVNAIILPGVHVNVGAVIGAGAVVTKDVPAYAIVGGIPAKVLKYRFDENTVINLKKIRWYEWDDSKIKNNLELFYDPKKFIERFND